MIISLFLHYQIIMPEISKSNKFIVGISKNYKVSLKFHILIAIKTTDILELRPVINQNRRVICLERKGYLQFNLKVIQLKKRYFKIIMNRFKKFQIRKVERQSFQYSLKSTVKIRILILEYYNSRDQMSLKKINKLRKLKIDHYLFFLINLI